MLNMNNGLSESILFCSLEKEPMWKTDHNGAGDK